jgi:hypothetical protein
LADYYSCIEPEEEHTLRFLVQQFRKLRSGSSVLEFGIGPTLHHLLPIAPFASEIHVADLLPTNLEAIRRWQVRESGAHDWSCFTRRVLELEGKVNPTTLQIYRREALTRQLITQRLIGDARRPEPLGPNYRGQYDCVLSCYCADSAVTAKSTWRHYMSNIASLVRPNGMFIVAALRNCSAYRVGEQYFPAACVDEHDITECLCTLGVEPSNIVMQVNEVPEQIQAGFDSVVLVSAIIS